MRIGDSSECVRFLPKLSSTYCQENLTAKNDGDEADSRRTHCVPRELACYAVDAKEKQRNITVLQKCENRSNNGVRRSLHQGSLLHTPQELLVFLSRGAMHRRFRKRARV